MDTHIRALEQAVLARVETQLGSLGEATVLGVRCDRGFQWASARSVSLGGRQIHVRVCPSVLAVLDALVGVKDDPGDPGVLVVLTPVEESELGPDVLARLYRHQLLEASRQTLLHDLAGGRSLDPAIVNTGWLSDALVDHFAAAVADPRDRAVPLTRQDGVDVLLVARLGLDPATLDLTTVLTQVVTALGSRRWDTVDPALRDNLVGEVRDRWGHLVATVLQMAAHRPDLLELLLLLDVIGYPSADMTAAGARGIVVNELLGPGQLDEGDQRALADCAVDLVRRRRTETTVVAAVDAAEARARAMGLGAVLGASSVLPSGLDRRFDAAAADLSEATLRRIGEHLGADQAHQQARIERLRCVLRLRRWLAHAGEPVTAVGPALQHYLDDDGWADRAVEEVGLGDLQPSVQRLLDEVRRAAVERRDATDQQAAERLAATASDALGSVVPVERALADVVAPLAMPDDARVLLVILDGMSVATAVGLAAEITGPGEQWREIVRGDGRGRRIPVLATLPSETTYSRTSLLTGALRRGTSSDERAAFAGLAAWAGRSAELFHRADLGGVGGADLGTDLGAALDREGRDTAVVGVVLNTVDDSLAKGVQGARVHLGVDDIGWLRALLQRAALAERIVVFVSDHGHVLDRGELTGLRSVPGAAARWRPTGTSSVVGAEVRVSGPRVLTDDHSGVFAATPALRYGKRCHGYHGGVALAEITVPLLAFVTSRAHVPRGWSLAGRVAPDWWEAPASVAPGPAVEVVPPTGSATERRPATVASAEPDLFEGAGHRAPAVRPNGGRGAAIVRSAAYASMAASVPAPLRLESSGVGRLLDAALAAGGTIGFPEALDAVGLAARNERGVFVGLRRLLNVDGYEVVTVSDLERTVTINRQLLDDQFPSRG